MDPNGIRKPLGEVFAQGGEGVVHRMGDHGGIIAKIYHPEILSNPTRAPQLRLKIEDMTSNQVLRDHQSLAWPLVSLMDESGVWCGYAMRLARGHCFRTIFGNPHNLATLAPGWHRQHLVRICLDFLSTIEALAVNKAIPVDFNPSNFLVDLDNIGVSFIDCDGFQHEGSRGMHLSGAFLPEMAAPEVIDDRQWSKNPVALESLRFSIGMMLFYILNLGNSPYRHRNGSDPVENLRKGACALGRGTQCVLPAGATYRIWSHLIYDLKELFIRCFRDGHGDPSVRPSVSEWREALLKYNHCLRAGHTCPALIPDHNKSSLNQ